MVCAHCNQEHPEGSLFCPVTGKKIIIPKDCPYCDKQVDPDWKHCGFCGQMLIPSEEIINPEEKQAKRSPRIPLLLLGGMVVLVAAILTISFWNGVDKVVSIPSQTITPTIIPGIIKGLVFVTNRDENPEIYMVNAEGGNQNRLTNNLYSDDVPDWSPVGQLIVYTSNQDGNNEIYVMNADGSNQTRLTDNEADDGFPDWSADGQLIAFFSNRDGNYEIYAMNADGRNQTRLTNSQANNGYPDWSADGEKLSFASDRDGNWEIYTINADGSNLLRLTNQPSSDGVPVWSPDGKQIAFASDRDGNFEIYKMNADGSDQIRLTNNQAIEGAPAWSIDGQKIAFTSNRDGNSEIYVMNIDGSNQTRLTNNVSYDGDPGWTDFAPPAGMTTEILPTEKLSSNPEVAYTMAASTVQAYMDRIETPDPANSIQPESNPGEMRQWADSARASSQYSNIDWAASQATGKPDVKSCGDNSKAWASRYGGSLDWLELTYLTPIVPTEINIYQSFNPSQIVEVMVIDLDGKKYSVWKGSSEKVENCPDLMTISLTSDKKIAVNKIWISVDQRVKGWGWNEIDAVELVGTIP